MNDAHEYLELRRAMDIVGISEDEQVSIFCCMHVYRDLPIGKHDFIF